MSSRGSKAILIRFEQAFCGLVFRLDHFIQDSLTSNVACDDVQT